MSSFQTREELRESLENEMRAFQVDKELGAKCVIGWNHKEFEEITQVIRICS
jgi:DnaJ family protein C protein 13